MTILSIPLDSQFSIRLRPTSATRAEDQALTRRIEAIWEAEQERRNFALHNGSMIALDAIEGSIFWARVTDYKHFIAQLRAPELRPHLGVKVLGVSGVIRHDDAIYFGKRSAKTTQSPGEWELVPSGGLTTDTLKDDGSIDAIKQLLDELREEVGVGASSVRLATPVVALEDTVDGVVDIGIELLLDAVHPQLARSDEYDELQLVPISDLESFLARHAIVPASRALIAALRR